MQARRNTTIVAGAARGIGAGVTNAFIAHGYNMVANSLSITGSTFAATERLAVVRGDAGDPSIAHEIAPTEELRQQIAELNGFMKGIDRCLGYLEQYQNGTDLFRQDGA